MSSKEKWVFEPAKKIHHHPQCSHCGGSCETQRVCFDCDAVQDDTKSRYRARLEQLKTTIEESNDPEVVQRAMSDAEALRLLRVKERDV